MATWFHCNKCIGRVILITYLTKLCFFTFFDDVRLLY
jgi:hypothetical protein